MSFVVNPQPQPRPAPVDPALAQAIAELLAYCRRHQWAGWDPYDSLNSPLFRLPFLQNRPCRLAFIQFGKRSPINLRPLFRVPREQNPKGLALFAAASLRLARAGLASADLGSGLLADLVRSRSPGIDHTCWGYNFPWQTRTYLVPRFTPNIICTTFAAGALLDGFEALGDAILLEHASGAGEFVVDRLNRTAEGDAFCFSYTPLDTSRIHNANLLGAALLARLHAHTGRDDFRELSLAATRYSVERIGADGSWPYGEDRTESWIDSFHTGYNLVALERIRRDLKADPLEPVIKKGFAYFLARFFTADARVHYYHDGRGPTDIHAIAQAIITLVELRQYDSRSLVLARQVLDLALNHMRSPEGWFFYQQHRCFTNRIPYMRWSQAWMLYAMSCLAATMAGPAATAILPDAPHQENTSGNTSHACSLQ